MKTENKLTYQRYKCSDNIITIDLHNGYTLRADKMWNRQQKHYEVEFMIRENTIYNWEVLETDSPITYRVDYRLINSAILCDVAARLKNGFFQKYIDSYEYDILCLNRGNNLIESEGIKNVP